MGKKDLIIIISICTITPLLFTMGIAPAFNLWMDVEEKRKETSIPITELKDDLGGKTLMVDASRDQWVFFSFESGIKRVGEQAPSDGKWDLAFKRKKIISNSGGAYPKGKVGIMNLFEADFNNLPETFTGEFTFNSVTKAGGDVMNGAIDTWYKYDFWSHTLKPVGFIYLVKTWDGKLGKLKIEDYYCGEAKKPGCYTIRYDLVQNQSQITPSA